MIIGPQVAFVDDIKREIEPLESALRERHTGTVFFDASPERNKFPEKPLETVKILFLDLYYKPQFDAELSAQWVQSIISPLSDYTLVIWSKDTHKKDELLNILEYIDLTPTHVETWQKTEFDLKNHNFSENVEQLITTISGDAYYEEDILFGEIINVNDDGVFINCRLNDDKPTFQVRKFDPKLLGNIEKIQPGVFVRIHIYSRPGARRMDVFEEKKDRSDLFEQPDFFKDIDGNAFFYRNQVKMKLTFKDVGQGDSILLEWEEGDKNKIGIIDCNRKYGKNPVKDHIEAGEYKEIEFIILSHPHTDHYSGMSELLTWIENNGIIVKSFGHTVHLLASDYYKYLNGLEAGTKAKGELQKLFDKVDELVKSGTIKKIDFIIEGTARDIKDEVRMKCLSPSKTEAEMYMKEVDLQPVKNTSKASASANLLSTVFKITVGDHYYLLTSDSETVTFERLMKEDIHVNLYKKKLKLAQVPHHGASVNHCGPFWDYVTYAENPDAAISAGLHETYKHPHLPVLQAFHNKGYEIHCTNIVYGMIEFADYLKELADLTDKLDTFTEVVESRSGGDKAFDLV